MVIVDHGQVQIDYRAQLISMVAGQGILPPGAAHREITKVASRIARFPLMAKSDGPVGQTPLDDLPMPCCLTLADPDSASILCDEAWQLTMDQQMSVRCKRLRGNLIASELLLNLLAGGFPRGHFTSSSSGDSGMGPGLSSHHGRVLKILI